MRGRFVLGASDGHAVGSIGGEENHTLNVNEMPSHGHVAAKTKSIVGWQDSSPAGYLGDVTSGTPITEKNPQTSKVGGDQPHNNMPPYYALSYIMKI